MMKNYTLYLGFILAFITMSCTVDQDDVPEVLSTWRLIETRISPSGEASFVPAEMEVDEVITFYTSSKITRNTAWCADSDIVMATYSIDGEIFTNCDAHVMLNFVIDGDIMTVSDPSCGEGCELKYLLVESNPVLGVY